MKFRNSCILLAKNWVTCFPEKNPVKSRGKSGYITIKSMSQLSWVALQTTFKSSTQELGNKKLHELTRFSAHVSETWIVLASQCWSCPYSLSVTWTEIQTWWNVWFLENLQIRLASRCTLTNYHTTAAFEPPQPWWLGLERCRASLSDLERARTLCCAENAECGARNGRESQQKHFSMEVLSQTRTRRVDLPNQRRLAAAATAYFCCLLGFI